LLAALFRALSPKWIVKKSTHQRSLSNRSKHWSIARDVTESYGTKIGLPFVTLKQNSLQGDFLRQVTGSIAVSKKLERIAII
jgi:hypothetical protein